jgi:hypothetical protein
MLLSTSLRLFLALGGFFAALSLPAWFVLIIMLLLALRYFAWEVLALGMFMDLVWQPFLAEASYAFFLPLFSLTALLLLWGLEPLRREFMMN